MLLDGVNHVAVITSDTERFHAFYREVFDATVGQDGPAGPGMRLSFVNIGPHTELNVFELEDGTTPPHAPMTSASAAQASTRAAGRPSGPVMVSGTAT